MRVRRLLTSSALTAMGLFGCNALLGIDDGTFLDPDAGAGGGDTALPTDERPPGESDASKPAEPLEVTMRKSALRVPRGARSTVVFDVGGFDSPNDPVELDVALPLPASFTYEGAYGDVKVATVTISAGPAAETPAATVPITFRRGAYSKVIDLQLRTGPSGTPDVTFGNGGVLELNRETGTVAPILVTETRGDLTTVDTSDRPIVARYDDTGLPRTIFGNSGGTTLGACESRSLLAQDDSVLVLASCGTTTRLYEVDGLGIVTVRATPVGAPLALAAMDAGVRMASAQNGKVELRAGDGGLVGIHNAGVGINLDTVAVAASAERFLFGVPREDAQGTSFALRGGDAGVDRTWGVDGAAPVPGFRLVSANFESFESVTAAPTAGGGVVFAGTKIGDDVVSVATILSATGASQTVTLNGTVDEVAALAQDAAGRFVIARYNYEQGGGAYLQRYTKTGVLDTSFGTNGRADLIVAEFTPTTVVFDGDGLILVGGYDAVDSVLRVWP